MLKKRIRLEVERLEDRLVPAMSATTINGSLYLTGSPMGQLNIIGTGAPYQFRVTDQVGLVSHPVGAGLYSITGNLFVNLQFQKGDIKLDLMGETLPGNVLFNLGVGYVGVQTPPNYSLDIYDSTGTGAIGGAGLGEIGGSVTLLGGNGMQLFNVGVLQTNPSFTFAQNPVTIDGNLTVVGARSTSSAQGNGLTIGDGTTIYGTVSTTNVSQVAIGSSTSGDAVPVISESVNISDAGSLRHLSVVDGGVIMQNLNVTGTTQDDSFALEQVTTPAMQSPGGGFVGGNLNVNLGQGTANGDQISLFANTEVDGNAYLTAGNNLNMSTGDQFKVLGMVAQNVVVNMGNTMNSLFFSAQNPGDPTPFVGGNMTVISTGAGKNRIGDTATGIGLPPPTGEFNGIVHGNLTFSLGSGANGSASDPMIIAAFVGGTLRWTSGNGQDFLQLGDSTTGLMTGADYNYIATNIQFGNKDDTFILDIGATGVITGTVNGGGRVVANTFTLLTGTEGTPFTMSNFP